VIAMNTTIEPSVVDADMITSRIFEQLERAWNAADGAGSGEVFADETDFVNIRGEYFRGDGVMIGEAHQGIFDTIYSGSTIRYEVESARTITPKSIVAVVTSTLDAPTGPLQGVNQSRITAIITEHESRWSIMAFQNTLVAMIV
jgi:uncharacterized protein (TIGR02246 family)